MKRNLRAYFAIVAGVWVAMSAVDLRGYGNAVQSFYGPAYRNLGHPFPEGIRYTRSINDLVALLPEELRKRYPCPARYFHYVTDRDGFRNTPELSDAYCPVVVVGDSYYTAGTTNEATFAGRLSSRLGLDIYNSGYPARGPIKPVTEFLASERFSKRPPKLLIYGFVERDAESFARDGSGGVGWGRTSLFSAVESTLLGPENLRYLANLSWVRARALAIRGSVAQTIDLGVESPVAAVDLDGGGHMLFSRMELDVLHKPLDRRGLVEATEYIRALKGECDRRDIALLVVPAPAKAVVYGKHVRTNEPLLTPSGDSFSEALEEKLKAVGVRCVNLLPAFEAASEGKELLYWEGDTHWSDYGIDLAARITAEYIGSDPELRAALDPSASGRR